MRKEYHVESMYGEGKCIGLGECRSVEEEYAEVCTGARNERGEGGKV